MKMEVKAAEANFTVQAHEHDGIKVGRTMHVCVLCGALGRTRVSVLWGRAPGQTRLDPDAEAEYVREQQS